MLLLLLRKRFQRKIIHNMTEDLCSVINNGTKVWITFRHALYILKGSTWFAKEGNIEVLVTTEGEVVLAMDDVPLDSAFYLLV